MALSVPSVLGAWKPELQKIAIQAQAATLKTAIPVVQAWVGTMSHHSVIGADHLLRTPWHSR